MKKPTELFKYIYTTAGLFQLVWLVTQWSHRCFDKWHMLIYGLCTYLYAIVCVCVIYLGRLLAALPERAEALISSISSTTSGYLTSILIGLDSIRTEASADWLRDSHVVTALTPTATARPLPETYRLKLNNNIDFNNSSFRTQIWQRGCRRKRRIRFNFN